MDTSQLQPSPRPLYGAYDDNDVLVIYEYLRLEAAIGAYLKDRLKLEDAPGRRILPDHDAWASTSQNHCLEPSWRYKAIHHILARALFTAIDFGSFSEYALLPPSMIAFWRKLPRSDWSWATCKPSSSSNSSRSRSRSRSRETRRLPAAVLQVVRAPHAIIPQVLKLRDLLCKVLPVVACTPRPPPWAGIFSRRSREQQQREAELKVKELEDLIWATARLGYTILSHPCIWAFNWHDPGMMLQMPRLLKYPNASGESESDRQPEPIEVPITRVFECGTSMVQLLNPYGSSSVDVGEVG
ncbi:hypothetical protein N656DRAFT_803081 [Canariomyces notabilis]|uniref:Uncharacterized protein n=1 Tax=Canariomyces notabilis TaxID=2074819 RepID=A0AAN6TLX6_9PEZI|nr:hypothetical protein N656DRAFT_803081 [Canariomyces arenarius]